MWSVSCGAVAYTILRLHYLYANHSAQWCVMCLGFLSCSHYNGDVIKPGVVQNDIRYHHYTAGLASEEEETDIQTYETV